MKKIIILLMFLSITFYSFAQESIAVSIKVKGNVELTRKEEVSKLEAYSELFNQDQIESGKDAFAAIKFVDGSTIVKVFPLSILTINAEESNGKMNKSSKLDLGELWTRVDPGSGDFEVETPTTVVSVKGTSFQLQVSDTGATTLYTITGQVEMKNKGDDESVLVSEGEKAYSTGTGPIDVTTYQSGEIDPDPDIDPEEDQTLEIQLENEDGEQKTINIDLK